RPSRRNAAATYLAGLEETDRRGNADRKAPTPLGPSFPIETTRLSFAVRSVTVTRSWAWRPNMAGTRMGVAGSGGRMGRMLVAEIVASQGCTLAGGCARPGSGYVNQDIGELAGIGRLGIAVGDSAEKMIRDSDVVIDFTAPAATATHVVHAARLGKAMVVGTTGLSADEAEAVRQAAREVPIVWAPNMSLGVNLLLGLVEEVARRLGPDWDVEIMEMHHGGKDDAPSGGGPGGAAERGGAARGRRCTRPPPHRRYRLCGIARRRRGRRPPRDLCGR